MAPTTTGRTAAVTIQIRGMADAFRPAPCLAQFVSVAAPKGSENLVLMAFKLRRHFPVHRAADLQTVLLGMAQGICNVQQVRIHQRHKVVVNSAVTTRALASLVCLHP